MRDEGQYYVNEEDIVYKESFEPHHIIVKFLNYTVGFYYFEKLKKKLVTAVTYIIYI